MPDNFSSYVGGLNSPASDGAAVTPNDNADLVTSSRYVFVGGAGALKVDLVSGNTLTLTGITAGTVLPLRVRRVYATGTTATNIAVLF